jgi:hypothetical protein
VSGIADRMGVKTEADADLEEITLDVAPEAVLDELEATDREPSSFKQRPAIRNWRAAPGSPS